MAQYQITKGPSKFDLSVALFHRPTNGEQYHTVTFTLEGGREVTGVLNSVSIEDGSRESWLIGGWFRSTKGSTNYTGYFDTRHRKGYLKFD